MSENGLLELLEDINIDEWEEDTQSLEFEGWVNRSNDEILENIRHNIRLQHPQAMPHPQNFERVALVAGGPSLEDTEGELRDLVFSGAKIVTVNGAYNWCIDRNFRPSATVILDSRAFNTRFVEREVPGCSYFLASQCDPGVFEACAGRDVYIFNAVEKLTPEIRTQKMYEHAGSEKHLSALQAQEKRQGILDEYYLEAWPSYFAGTTATVVALWLFRILGFRNFDIFGFDSCVRKDKHHAYDQAENDQDSMALPVKAGGKEFFLTGWQIRQVKCFFNLMRDQGGEFGYINVHGDGIIQHLMKMAVKTKETKSSAPVKLTVV